MHTYNFELCHMTAQTSRLYSFTKVIKFIANIKKYFVKTVYMLIIHNLSYIATFCMVILDTIFPSSSALNIKVCEEMKQAIIEIGKCISKMAPSTMKVYIKTYNLHNNNYVLVVGETCYCCNVLCNTITLCSNCQATYA